MALVLCVGFTVLGVAFDSYPLQDGYRLQGWLGGGGKIYSGYFKPIISADVMGTQGSNQEIIFGWVAGRPSNYFVLNTKTGRVEWLNATEQAHRLATLGCPAPDMNREVNLIELKNRFRSFSRE